MEQYWLCLRHDNVKDRLLIKGRAGRCQKGYQNPQVIGQTTQWPGAKTKKNN